ncbi:MAG: hypothetical protein HY748_17105 [Elusimicrobia bacterium]|nr:hypothetical protein [Elusimicrobiota bacterium]
MRRYCFVALAAAAASGCFMKKPDFIAYTHEKAGFAVEIPSAWTVIENRPEFNPGVQLLAPPVKGRRAVRRSMTVDFYPAGDKQYSSIEDFISARTRSLPGYSYEELKSATVAGIPAKELAWRKPLPQSPEFSPKGAMVTRALLFSYGGGFYVLADATAEGDPEDAGGLFARLVKSFKPAQAGR